MSASIQSLVDRGWEVRRQLKLLKKELEEIQGKLSQTALWKDHEPLVDKDREGRRYMAKGSNLVVPVVFTADKIVGEFAHNGATHRRIMKLGVGIGPFFELKQVWENRFKDGNEFRRKAAEHLAFSGPEFVTACLALDKHGIPKSDTKVAWNDAEPLAKKEAA